MQKIDSRWTDSLNFNLLNAGALAFFTVGYLMYTKGHVGETLIASAMTVLFLSAIIFTTIRRNLKFVYSEQHLELQRFPYVAKKTWNWQDIHSVHINDECLDDSMDKTGEALYVLDNTGKRVMVAHRYGQRTELRQVASEIRRRIS
jgi:hypothetical protein